jgi:spore germination protein GerM
VRRVAGTGARRVLCSLAAVAIGGLALGACGIPTQPSASPISSSQFQGRLNSGRHTEPPCTQSVCVPVDVYFEAKSGRLTAVGRVVLPHAKIGSVIGALLDGPTAPERADGIESAFGPRIHLLSGTETQRKRTVTLDFTPNFGALSGSKEVLSVAQVVYTVTAYTLTAVKPDVGVIFELGTAPIEVPVESGALADTAVHEVQYAAMLTTTTPKTTL